MKVAQKPKEKLVSQEDDTLVTDHGIDGLVLHHDFDGKNQTFSGILEMAAGTIAFETSFDTQEAWDDKVKVREALINSAVYTDSNREGKSAAGHIAMNANFKRLLKYVLASLTEQEAQTAE